MAEWRLPALLAAGQGRAPGVRSLARACARLEAAAYADGGRCGLARRADTLWYTLWTFVRLEHRPRLEVLDAVQARAEAVAAQFSAKVGA